jgi:acyl-homoserine lactone acylase PvdQ
MADSATQEPATHEPATSARRQESLAIAGLAAPAEIRIDDAGICHLRAALKP